MTAPVAALAVILLAASAAGPPSGRTPPQAGPMKVTAASGILISAALVACGSTGHRPVPQPPRHAFRQARHAPHPARHSDRTPLALVTAESVDELIAVDLRSGHVHERLRLPTDPEDIAVAGSSAVVVSPTSRMVALISLRPLRVTALLHGFTSPHVAALSPNGQLAYVTDDGAGTVTPIRLADARRFPSLRVGFGAHHLTFSPDGRIVWVALGETAHTIVQLDTHSPAHPRITGRWQPPHPVHDLRFAPSGTTVWLSSATGPHVTVVDARTHTIRLRIHVGRPPQHIAFGPNGAYLTSGYGRLIERVDPTSGHVLDRATTPYGSFELDARGAYVATSSLLQGTLALFDPRLHLRRLTPLAPATREVAIAP